jgi:hypothetical protein
MNLGIHRPGSAGLALTEDLPIAQSTRSIGVDCVIGMAAPRPGPTKKFVLTLLVVGEMVGV